MREQQKANQNSVDHILQSWVTGYLHECRAGESESATATRLHNFSICARKQQDLWQTPPKLKNPKTVKERKASQFENMRLNWEFGLILLVAEGMGPMVQTCILEQSNPLATLDTDQPRAPFRDMATHWENQNSAELG